MVIDAKLISPLIQIITRGNYKTLKESAWVVSNLAFFGNIQQVYLVCVNITHPLIICYYVYTSQCDYMLCIYISHDHMCVSVCV